MYRIRAFSPTKHEEWLSSELVPSISQERLIASSGSLVPHLAGRHWAHHLPNIQLPEAYGSGLVDCAIFDREEINTPLTPEQYEAMPGMLKSRGYKPVFICGPTTVFQRGEASCLSRTPSCPSAN